MTLSSEFVGLTLEAHSYSISTNFAQGDLSISEFSSPLSRAAAPRYIVILHGLPMWHGTGYYYSRFRSLIHSWTFDLKKEGLQQQLSTSYPGVAFFESSASVSSEKDQPTVRRVKKSIAKRLDRADALPRKGERPLKNLQRSNVACLSISIFFIAVLHQHFAEGSVSTGKFSSPIRGTAPLYIRVPRSSASRSLFVWQWDNSA